MMALDQPPYPVIFFVLFGLDAILLVVALTSRGKTTAATPPRKTFLQFGKSRFSVEAACRHWVCVGKSGCGKTSGFIKSFIIQITRNVPRDFGCMWGGVITDDKGDFAELVIKIFSRMTVLGHGAAKHLVVLRAPAPNDEGDNQHSRLQGADLGDVCPAHHRRRRFPRPKDEQRPFQNPRTKPLK